jgi:hypothetical protein
MSGITSIFSQPLGYFTFKEGIEKANIRADSLLGKPTVLIGAMSSNKSQFIYGQNFEGKIIFEGDDIGKSNYWSYYFVAAEDSTNGIEISAVKVIPAGNQIMVTKTENISDLHTSIYGRTPINLDSVMNSDVFINGTNASFYNGESGELGVFAYADSPTLWNLSIKYNYSPNYYMVCQAPYNDSSLISCVSGIEDNPDNSGIGIYPSPTTDFINIKNDNQLIINEISIIDIDGKEAYKISADANIINVSNLNIGNYYISFKIRNLKVFCPFIKK